jgi:Asp-tRNA(Asn)/Glu-tRNA(Gln) amidotransferase A subunit family amidase
VEAAWERAVKVLAPQAQRCEDAMLPADFGDVAAVQAALQAHETATALADEHRRHRDLLSPALLALLDKGRTIDAMQVEAHRVRTVRWRVEVDTLFDRFDVLLTPSAVDEAPEGLQHTGDPVFCRPWSLLGLPCVHLPFATGATGLPVGLQLVGRFGEDHRLMAAAQWAMQRLA